MKKRQHKLNSTHESYAYSMRRTNIPTYVCTHSHRSRHRVFVAFTCIEVWSTSSFYRVFQRNLHASMWFACVGALSKHN